MKCHRRAILALISVVASLCCSISRAERASYSFQGMFPGSSSQIYQLFGYNVPRNSLVNGTFSYDTTTPGVDIATGKRLYHQTIDGGMTLDINNGQVQVAASDYGITVGNDQGSPAIDSFQAEYINFNSSGIDITVQPVVVTGANGTTTWSGITQIKVFLSWDSSAFPDPGLTAEEPAISSPSVVALVGSATSGTGVAARLFTNGFSISAPPLPAGDYNGNNRLDLGDYNEWRKAYGCTDSACLYADGNGDGVVDAADYVLWRHGLATATGSHLAQVETVPEPNVFALCFSAFVTLVGCWRGMVPCRWT